MRKIRFRGKSLTTGEWLHGWLYGGFDGESRYIYDNNGSFVDTLQAPGVDPDTVGQFTGLYDCTGKEIYEGDILEYCSGMDSFGGIFQTVRIEYRAAEGGYVGINQYRETRDKREIVQSIVRCLNKCRVCGNIHDNQEFLDKQ